MSYKIEAGFNFPSLSVTNIVSDARAEVPSKIPLHLIELELDMTKELELVWLELVLEISAFSDFSLAIRQRQMALFNKIPECLQPRSHNTLNTGFPGLDFNSWHA